MRTSILAILLLALSTFAAAQHHGGHGMGGGIPGGSGGRPTGVEEKDTLKDFHQALAVQATAQQVEEFQELVKSTKLAHDKTSAFGQEAANHGREGVTAVDQAIGDALTRNKKFLSGFSKLQKSGLKEITKRLEKANADLEQEAKHLDQIVEAEATPSEVSGRAESLQKVVTDFSNVQLALGRDMGITLASGQDLSFNLPVVKIPVRIGRRTVEVDNSGFLTQTDAAGDIRTFQLELSADLSDLQQSLADVMTAHLGSSRGCGDRLFVKRATLMAATPASSLELNLHFERWSCTRLLGQTSDELAEGDGTVELKLTPAIEKSALQLTADFKRIDATGMMGEELRSGDLGDDLREQAVTSILTAAETVTDLQKTLPPALQNTPSFQGAKFQDSGTGSMNIVLLGQIKISNEQVNALAGQLNQKLSAQGSHAQ